MIAAGSVFKFGDDVDTDVIIPARYLNTADPAELAPHCMEDIDASFASRVRKGDILVAGENFGCGSSREHAPIAIQAVGAGCVIAASFARIFFRNAVNIGLPILECPDAARDCAGGDRLEIDLERGTIRNRTRDQIFHAEPFPAFVRDIIREGGLIPYVARLKHPNPKEK
jgi:3-isopropylmalate/(R)-2-methylmalate dehydratase small subunit